MSRTSTRPGQRSATASTCRSRASTRSPSNGQSHTPNPGYQNLRGDTTPSEVNRPNHPNIHKLGYFTAVADRLEPYVNARENICKSLTSGPMTDEVQKMKREVIKGKGDGGFTGLPPESKLP
jgi:hypothetical protein